MKQNNILNNGLKYSIAVKHEGSLVNEELIKDFISSHLDRFFNSVKSEDIFEIDEKDNICLKDWYLNDTLFFTGLQDLVLKATDENNKDEYITVSCQVADMPLMDGLKAFLKRTFKDDKKYDDHRISVIAAELMSIAEVKSENEIKKVVLGQVNKNNV